MLTVRSMTTGEVLGFAKDHATAQEMARTNSWNNWCVEEVELRELRLVETQNFDPRNRRGKMA